ncbi:MAG: DinB family protein [Actinomycetota bacterium]|nr:DinB family protein [Actinomycetota bacterium]
MTLANPLPRSRPPKVVGEREALVGWLDYHRATLLTKLEGLDDEQLRRPMVPSGLCLLGLVKHLTAVEHGWFGVDFAQTEADYLFVRADGSEADFDIEPADTTESVVAGYLEACEHGRAVVEGAESLDATVQHSEVGELGLRWVVTHMIEETARHNGHADIIRELIDGTTGD